MANTCHLAGRWINNRLWPYAIFVAPPKQGWIALPAKIIVNAKDLDSLACSERYRRWRFLYVACSSCGPHLQRRKKYRRTGTVKCMKEKKSVTCSSRRCIHQNPLVFLHYPSFIKKIWKGCWFSYIWDCYTKPIAKIPKCETLQLFPPNRGTGETEDGREKVKCTRNLLNSHVFLRKSWSLSHLSLGEARIRVHDTIEHRKDVKP